ncbi:MAG: lysoplasmalogenase family protein [Treponemataceae bacterium]
MNFSILSLLSLAVFVVGSIVHLVRCYQRRLGLSDITKFILMPLLAIFYVLALLGASFGIINILVLSALVCFWLGDIFLIYDWERVSFYFGMFFFMLAQIFLIVATSILLKDYPFPLIAGLAILLVFIIILAIKLIFLKKPFAFIGLKFTASLYLISTTVLSYLLVILAIANFNVYTVLMAVGGLCFMLSDYHVIEEYYISGNKFSRFLIMLGYLVGTGLIVVGFAGLQLLQAA